MRGPLSEDRREPWSELKIGDLLSALAFGASFEDIANFLIDNVAEREIVCIPCAARLTDLRVAGVEDKRRQSLGKINVGCTESLESF
jgi:hypothetical protein